MTGESDLLSTNLAKKVVADRQNDSAHA